MPTLRIHTHCQVAQKSQRTDQNLSKSMAAPTHTKTADADKTKKCFDWAELLENEGSPAPNKVSYVMRAKVLNLGVSTINKRCINLIVRSFESRTTHTLFRCVSCKERPCNYSQRTFGTFAIPSPLADTSACKRAKF